MKVGDTVYSVGVNRVNKYTYLGENTNRTFVSSGDHCYAINKDNVYKDKIEAEFVLLLDKELSTLIYNEDRAKYLSEHLLHILEEIDNATSV